MPPFTLEQLRALQAIIEWGTFEAAADELKISPSAISQRIKSFERRLGHSLLHRTVPATPTEAGARMLQLARQISFLSEQAAHTMSTAPLPIAVNADSLASWFTGAFHLIARSDLPGIDLRIEDEDYSADLLRRGEVIAAVTSGAPTVPGCIAEPIGTMEYVGVVRTNLWQQYSHLPLQQALSQLPILIFNRKDSLQDEVLLSTTTALSSQGPRSYIPSSREFTDAVYAGLGWAAIPVQQAAEGLESGELTQLPQTTTVKRPLQWQHWAVESPTLATLTEIIMTAQQQYQAGIEPHQSSPG